MFPIGERLSPLLGGYVRQNLADKAVQQFQTALQQNPIMNPYRRAVGRLQTRPLTAASKSAGVG